MLKMLKYEIIQSWRNFMFVYFGYLLLCLMFPAISWTTINELQAILLVALTLTIFGISIGVFITIARNYKNSMFGRSGYLTMTLPVSSHELILVKLLAGFLWIILSGAVLFIGYLIVMFSLVGADLLLEAVKGFFTNLGELVHLFGIEIIQVIVLAIISILTSILLIFFAFTVSHSSFIRSHRTFWAIVIIAVISIIFPTIMEGATDIITVQNIYLGSNAIEQALDAHFWISILTDSIQLILFYLGTWYILEKKIEIQ